MILLKNFNYFPEDYELGRLFDEYLQSAQHGYKFTFMEHINEKDKKYYKYNARTNRFDEIKLDSI